MYKPKAYSIASATSALTSTPTFTMLAMSGTT
jgi:hypothetical protein